MNTNYNLLLNKHHELDYLCRNPRGRIFVSDWYCQHPFAQKYLSQEPFTEAKETDLLYYCFQNDSHEIHDEIITFHQKNDGVTYAKEDIYVGAGMTPLITAQMIMLKTLGVKEIYYTRPLYYTFYYLSQLFDIKLIPVCDIPLNIQGIELVLPKQKTCLVVCDPLWYMGKNILAEYIEKIKVWQDRTESYVLVDGAFQYMKWDIKQRKEATSLLNKELTFRSLCPTKALAVHGIRFSYTLLPQRFQEDMRYAYANSFGSSCIFSHIAAKRVMQVLNMPNSNFELLQYIQEKYRLSLERKLFIDEIGADCTYFIFVKMLGDSSKYIMMDQDFFDTTNYPNHTRLNLLLLYDL